MARRTLIPSVSVPESLGILQGAQPGATTKVNVNFEGRESWNGKFIVSDRMMVDGRVAEAAESQDGDEGCRKLNFLSTKWKEGECISCYL
jgi:hypothetical protein